MVTLPTIEKFWVQAEHISQTSTQLSRNCDFSRAYQHCKYIRVGSNRGYTAFYMSSIFLLCLLLWNKTLCTQFDDLVV